ncbi:MAG: tRNA lysidine(34) synthetase TilS [Oleiphilaceae bacterium]|nr:tRNA lysidine(34) synthetase TilS [Oleiphilaceae bacterium]
MGRDANPASPVDWPGDLSDAFAALPTASRWVVALSGGLDSVFLLHCLATLSRRWNQPLRALHIHHGLQSDAGHWADFCQQQCRHLDLPLSTQRLHLDPDAPDLEATARQARYGLFRKELEEGDLLLMGHHGDDQAETLLLRLMRGSGVRGLAGMPATRPLGSGQLHRPLLPLSRQRIETLAREWQLDWCEDHSNQDRRFDRNYLRHEVLPALRARWPQAPQSLQHSAAHCREADELLEELAREDLARSGMEEGLTVTGLNALSERRQRNLVRYRLRRHGLQPPGEARLTSGLKALLNAGEDRTPALHWQNHSIRRYRNRLWLIPALPPAESLTDTPWHPDTPLPWAGTTLTASNPHPGKTLTVTPRQGGEHFRPSSNQPSRPLKKWLQEQGLPPWHRERLPLVWDNNTLVAIGDLWSDGQWQLHWERPGSRL